LELENILETKLIENNLVSYEDILKAKEIQKKYGSHLGIILINLGLLSEEDYIKIVSEIFNLPILDLAEFSDIERISFKEIDTSFFIEKNIFPFYRTDSEVYVAIDYRLNYDDVLFLKSLLNLEIKVYLSSEEILEQLKELYENKSDILDVSSEEEIEKLKELASEAPVIKLINRHFKKAVEMRASDIHYETFKTGMKVRFRIDGVLRNFDVVPSSLKNSVIARLKLLSKMNIAENRLPQDGRISIQIMQEEIDIRASSIPTAFGESFVLRLLRKQNMQYSLKSLDFFEDSLKLLKDIISKPHGIFLTTGPTGSGKTTTLYSILNELNSEKVKIITVEDPVEYELNGVNQIQVKPEIGFNFANALRSILRQDPDIIMIGEIRDFETASIAIQSALTGHFVLSTLHTNSALGAITRLLDMGIEFFLLKSSIKGLMAQRLVRKLCPFCKEKITLSKNMIDLLKIDNVLSRYSSLVESIDVYRPVGCEKCGYSGYLGRTPIVELVPFDEKLQFYFERDKNFNNISKLGYRSLFEDGVLKFLTGKTSFEEIIKIME
jgi:general secretion pathway protein E